MEQNTNKFRVLANYAIRRILRIYPMYIVALPFLPTIATSREPLISILNHLSLRIGLEHFWSIAVELKYYALLPIVALFLLLLVRKNIRLLLPALFLFIILYGFMYEHISASVAPRQLPNELSIWLYLPAFIVGSAISFMPVLAGQWRRVVEACHVEIFFALIFLFILSLLFSYHIFMFENYTLGYYFWLIFYSILWSAVIYLLVNLSNPLTKIFENRYLRIIGRISFSAYLWHYSLFLWNDVAVEHGFVLPPYILVPVIFILTLILAAITYHFIEKPFLKISLLQIKRS